MPPRNTVYMDGAEWSYSFTTTSGGFYLTYTQVSDADSAEIEVGDTETLDNFLGAFAIR